MDLNLGSMAVGGTFSLAAITNLKPINWFRLRVSLKGQRFFLFFKIAFLDNASKSLSLRFWLDFNQ